jgi:hypothetical protein
MAKLEKGVWLPVDTPLKIATEGSLKHQLTTA